MKIVCLDGYTLNPGDLSWDCFKSLGDITVHDRTPEDQILTRSEGALVLLTNKTPLSAETLAKLPDLKYIGVLATGYNVVDIDAANAAGVTVANVPTYGTDSVAQHAIALLLEFARQVSTHHQAVHEGQWVASDDFCFARKPIFELTGKTFGLIGLGRIGMATAKIAAALGMNLIAATRTWPPRAGLDGLDITHHDIDAVFRQADVVSLHCPLTPETDQLVNATRLATMKPSAVLLNTSRGPLIDEAALAAALEAGTIAGAGLDVLSSEPPSKSNPLLTAPRCVITPHLAWYAIEARQRLMTTAANNLRSFFAGSPEHVVNDPA